MLNIEEQKFSTRELATLALKSWAKEHGKKPTQEELDECIDVHWEENGRWMISNMDGVKDNPPPNAYYCVTNYLEDIND